jgi:hypothetical protein
MLRDIFLGTEEAMSVRSDQTPLSVRSDLKRPRILILFGWFLIVTGLLSPFVLLRIDDLPTLFPLWESRFPAGVHHLVIAAGGAIRVACGVGLLSGFEWSRVVWLLACFALAGFDLLAFPPSARTLVPSVVLPALSLYLLFRPSVNDYFVAISSQNYPDLR